MTTLMYLGSGAFAQKNQDDLRRRILAQAQGLGPDDYAFIRTVRAEHTFGGKTEKELSVERYDPTKPADARWTLVSVNDAAPSSDELKTFRTESAKRRIPGYYRLARYFDAPSTTSTDSRGRTAFHFSALPKGAVLVLDSEVSRNTIADASVSETDGTPFVEQMHLLVKPMRLKLLMKLEKYESTARYRIGAEGKPLLTEQISDLTGSGMGKQGSAHTVITYTDYRAVKKE